ncbi:protoheme IX farnesyltransferase [Chloroflexota bacterium]
MTEKTRDGIIVVADSNKVASHSHRELKMRHVSYQIAKDYIEVLKPRESSLLTFIGVCTAVIAGHGHLPLDKLLFILIMILLVSAGVNGLTNYLDRHIDAKMQRTRHRALPSKRIYPAEKVLPLTVGLIIIGLVLAWQLHPLSFLAGLVGTVVATLWRKKWTCVFPQGVLASCAPVLMGWFATNPTFSWQLLLLCLLIAVWVPLHLWSVMTNHREDYLSAGISYFPVSREAKEVVKLLLMLSLMLYAASITIYFVGSYTWLYLVIANLLGCVLVYTSLRLVISTSSKDSWRLYKLSAFPYLGLIFLAMCLSVWLSSG